jgi:cell division protein FtsZ
MLIDEVTDAYAPTPSHGIGASLRRGGGSEPAAPATADFGNDTNYLDIPAFLRRQAD